MATFQDSLQANAQNGLATLYGRGGFIVSGVTPGLMFMLVLVNLCFRCIMGNWIGIGACEVYFKKEGGEG